MFIYMFYRQASVPSNKHNCSLKMFNDMMAMPLFTYDGGSNKNVTTTMYYVYSTSFIVPLLHRAPHPPTEPCNQWQPQCRPFLCPVAPTKTSVTLSQPGRSPPVAAWEAWAVWWRGQTCLQPKAAVQCPRLDPNRPTAS